jgi:hypothetical protein
LGFWLWVLVLGFWCLVFGFGFSVSHVSAFFGILAAGCILFVRLQPCSCAESLLNLVRQLVRPLIYF